MPTPKPKLRHQIDSAGARWVEDTEPPKPDPYAVPEAWREAYDRAIPAPAAFFEDAVTALAVERFPSSIIDVGMRDQVRKDSMPEVLRRADHLSKNSQARAQVRAAEQDAELTERRAREGRCPVCGEHNPPVSIHRASFLPAQGWKACNGCAETARELYSASQRTKARDAAVRAALGL